MEFNNQFQFIQNEVYNAQTQLEALQQRIQIFQNILQQLEFQYRAEQLLNLTFTDNIFDQTMPTPRPQEIVETIKYGTLKIDMEMKDIYDTYYYVSRVEEPTIMFWISKEELMLVSVQW